MDLHKDFKLFSCATLLFFLSLLPRADAAQPGVHPENPIKFEPWFTGPLLAPSGHVVRAGNINIEPYLFVFGDNGTYDKHWHAHSTDTFYTVAFQVPVQIGITQKIDFQIAPQVLYQHFHGQSSTHFGDLPIGFDFQLLHEDSNPRTKIAIKFGVQETFPTGKYQHLNPKKQQTDDVGGGSFATSFLLVFSRLFHFCQHHFLSVRLGVADTIPAPVHVRGFNAYGGGRHAHGKVYPGNMINAVVGLEYSFSQKWVIACDIQNNYSNKTRFKGNAGTKLDGTPSSAGGPSSDQFSLAPAIEYNFSSSLGLIAGSWFTVTGRNTDRFWSAVVAFNYYLSYGEKKPPRHSHGGRGGSGAKK